MIVSKTITYGIDSKINLIQRYLDLKLPDIWEGKNYIYGRAVKVLRNDKVTLQFWDAKDDYKELFIDNKIPVTVGFIERDRNLDNNSLNAEVDIVFCIDVKAAYGTNIYEDEKAFVDAYRLISSCGYISSVTGTETGIANVFSGFYTDNIKFADMSPFTVFSFRCIIDYIDNIC